MTQTEIQDETIAKLLAELDAAKARVQRLMAVVRQCPCIGYTTCSGRRAPINQMCPRCAALAEGENV